MSTTPTALLYRLTALALTGRLVAPSTPVPARLRAEADTLDRESRNLSRRLVLADPATSDPERLSVLAAIATALDDAPPVPAAGEATTWGEMNAALELVAARLRHAVELAALGDRLAAATPTAPRPAPPTAPAPEAPPAIDDGAPALRIDLGAALIDLAAGPGALPDRIGVLRSQLADDLGFHIPPVHLRDDLTLPADAYVIRLDGAAIGRYRLRPDAWLALDTGAAAGPLDGEPTTDPAFGLRGWWVSADARGAASAAGYALVDPCTVLMTHFGDLIRRHAPAVFGHHELDAFFASASPDVVDALVPQPLSRATVHAVLRGLLAEGVAVSPPGPVLDGLSEGARATGDPGALVEHVRRHIGALIADRYVDVHGALTVIELGPAAEALLDARPGPEPGGAVPGDVRALVERAARIADADADGTGDVVVLCAPALRPGLRAWIRAAGADLPVLSRAELPPSLTLRRLGRLDPDRPAA